METGENQIERNTKGKMGGPDPSGFEEDGGGEYDRDVAAQRMWKEIVRKAKGRINLWKY